VIVVPCATAVRAWREIVIRHAYGHTLPSDSSVVYPARYEEGTAEMMSTLGIGDTQSAFTIGGLTPRPIGQFRWTVGGKPKLEFAYDRDQLIGGAWCRT